MHNTTTTRSRDSRIVVGLIAAALLLGACGGDDGDARQQRGLQPHR